MNKDLRHRRMTSSLWLALVTLPAYASADVTNTAAAIFVDEKSHTASTVSNTVVITTSGLGSSTGPANPAGDLSLAQVYPNPWRSDRVPASVPVAFNHIPSGSTVKIFTISGHLVISMTADTTGRVNWLLVNDRGDHVATGMYLYLIKSPGGSKVKGTLAIIR